VTVQLEPESLGRVHLVLAREPQGLVAQFRVETPEAHQALLGEASVLKRELEAQGVPLVRVTVDLDREAAERREPRESRRTARRSLRSPAFETQPLSEAPAHRRLWGFETRV
jgi:flagellar hook-length control protein FliK